MELSIWGFKVLIKQNFNEDTKFGWTTYVPKFEFTTDNAAMIAIVGYLKYLEGDFSEQNITASARLKI